MPVKVLFVCLGNICRSPTAHGLFRDKVQRAGLAEHIEIDSAGTGDWHIDHAPDKRAQATAIDRGYDISDLRARLVTREDFAEFDYILGMDASNISNMMPLKPEHYSGTFGLFLDVAHKQSQGQEVDDPYYGDDSHFRKALEEIEQGCEALLQRITREHDLKLS